jgi:hypothetical protein
MFGSSMGPSSFALDLEVNAYLSSLMRSMIPWIGQLDSNRTYPRITLVYVIPRLLHSRSFSYGHRPIELVIYHLTVLTISRLFLEINALLGTGFISMDLFFVWDRDKDKKASASITARLSFPNFAVLDSAAYLDLGMYTRIKIIFTGGLGLKDCCSAQPDCIKGHQLIYLFNLKRGAPRQSIYIVMRSFLIYFWWGSLLTQEDSQVARCNPAVQRIEENKN